MGCIGLFFLCIAFNLVFEQILAQKNANLPKKKKTADYNIASRKALEYFLEGQRQMQYRDYKTAASFFQKAVALEPEFINALYGLGASIYLSRYVTTSHGYYFKGAITEIIPYLEKVIQREPKQYPMAQYYLAHAYMQNHQYAQAVPLFESFLQLKLKQPLENKIAAQNLKKSQYAQQAIQKPIQFKAINLGDSINTEGDEYNPSLTADGKLLFFTGRRKDATGGFNKFYQNYCEDFYYSKLQNNGWSKALNLGQPVNTPYNEGGSSISQDGQTVYFTSCERKDVIGRCDLYAAFINGKDWQEPRNLGPKINSVYYDAQPCLSHDGKWLYFVSDRPGGIGNNDIWVSEKIGGRWQEPQNLGPIINTPGNEYYPFLFHDGRTLFFVSDGHDGFGGMDVFVSTLGENNQWNPPQNLGYPLNTAGDEHSFVLSYDAKTAYLATNNLPGKGNMDIYTFELDERLRPTPAAYVQGWVRDSATQKNLSASITFIDLQTGDTLRKITTNTVLGTFLLSLPLYRYYAAYVEAPGYLFKSIYFDLKQASSRPYEINAYLSAVNKGKALTLNNIFFEIDSYELKKESFIELQKLYELLQAQPRIRIEIQGHTDNTGQEEYNQKLSLLRAQSIKKYLQEKGISADRLSVRGFGATQPIADNSTEEGRKQNRRTVIIITESQE
jgi:outer membrane protein OmpA-like peptidoglycan-associated protein